MNIIDYENLTDEIAHAGCLVRNMPNDAYHDYPALNKSSIDLIIRSPAHYAFAPPREKTRAMVIGSAIHAAVLEPKEFAKDYVLLKDVTDRRSSEYKQAVKVHSADYVLTGKEAQNIIDMQNSVDRSDIAQTLLAAGDAELTAFGRDPVTGVLCKIKMDFLTPDLNALDLKKTQDIRDFYKSVGNYGYHIQHAFYSDVFEWATGLQLKSFVFMAVEEKAPCCIKFYQLDDVAVNIGRKKYREAVNIYADCEKNNTWPAPDESLEYISLPPWMTEEQLTDEDEF